MAITNSYPIKNPTVEDLLIGTEMSDIVTANFTVQSLINLVTSYVPTGEGGATGPAGPQGPAGNDGTSINILGTVPTSTSLPTSGNTVGDLYITDDTGDGWVWAASLAWINIGPLRGPQGIQGPAGTAGTAGATGPTGPTGATGPQGPQGIPGSGVVSGTINYIPKFTSTTEIGDSIAYETGGKIVLPETAVEENLTVKYELNAGEVGVSTHKIDGFSIELSLEKIIMPDLIVAQSDVDAAILGVPLYGLYRRNDGNLRIRVV